MSQLLIKYFTSHYGRPGLPGKRTLAITPVIPKDYRGRADKRLAPSSSLLNSWRGIQSPQDLQQWKEAYFSLLGQKITPADAAALVDGKILLAHESHKATSFRHVLKDWFKFFGIEVESREWGGESPDEIDQRIFPFMKERQQ